MKEFNIYILSILILLIAGNIQSQELVKKKNKKDKILEEYFVRKDNKKIKQGHYLSTYMYIMLHENIVEFGQFDNNLRTEQWYSFYFVNPQNTLKSFGEYNNGKKNGNWYYYYESNPIITNIAMFAAPEKHTQILDRKKSNNEFIIAIDTTGANLMSSGEYFNDKKTGIWNYFSNSGKLLHKFDHSKNEMIEDNLIKTENDIFIFLGGTGRFNNYFHTAFNEVEISSQITETSKVVYEFDENGNYNFIQGHGQQSFIEDVAKIIDTLPNEWICHDTLGNARIQFIIKYTCENNINTISLKTEIIE